MEEELDRFKQEINQQLLVNRQATQDQNKKTQRSRHLNRGAGNVECC